MSMMGFYRHMEISPWQTTVIIFRIRMGLRVAGEKEWKKTVPTFTLQFKPEVCLPSLMQQLHRLITCHGWVWQLPQGTLRWLRHSLWHQEGSMWLGRSQQLTNGCKGKLSLSPSPGKCTPSVKREMWHSAGVQEMLHGVGSEMTLSTSAYVSLAKATHVTKAVIHGARKYSPPSGRDNRHFGTMI